MGSWREDTWSNKSRSTSPAPSEKILESFCSSWVSSKKPRDETLSQRRILWSWESRFSAWQIFSLTRRPFLKKLSCWTKDLLSTRGYFWRNFEWCWTDWRLFRLLTQPQRIQWLCGSSCRVYRKSDLVVWFFLVYWLQGYLGFEISDLGAIDQLIQGIVELEDRSSSI